MRKRALLAHPSLAVSVALTSFAASIIKEEERKKKKRARAAAEGDVPDSIGDNYVVAGDDSEAEGSSNRVRKGKKSRARDIGDSNDRSTQVPGIDPAGSSLNFEENGRDEAEALEDWSLPTDTLVALKMMCQQFPSLEQVDVGPFALRSQIYSSVSDRTTADRELEELKRQHVVRIFKLNTGKDDFGIMLMEEYLKQIEIEKKHMGTKRSEEEIRVFDWFATHVVPAHTGDGIRHPHLLLLLSQGGTVKEQQISLLINSGLLVRQISDEAGYWFGIPNVGFVLKSLSGGRKELQSFLSKRRYKEMLQAVLEKKRLRSSQFNMRFHLRDLLGSGHIYSVHTPAGPLIRLARN